ncbi:MAG: AEC family transporter [Pseudomonadota bacterium]
MTIFDSLLQSFVLLATLGSAAILLRARGTIRPEEQAVFGRLVTDFALPALIFLSISSEPFLAERLLLAALIFCSIASVGATAWVIGRLFRLEKPVLGAVIMVSSFGSSSTLGYLLVLQIYGNDPSIMGAVVTMGEIGVHLPMFTLGVAVAVYFGTPTTTGPGLWAAVRPFFYSPIFLAMVLGVAASRLQVYLDHWVLNLLNEFLEVAANTLIFLVAFTLGLMLRPVAFGRLASLLAIVASLKLVLEPLIALAAGGLLNIEPLGRELLVLESGMPASMVAGVIAARYGCDGATASTVVVATHLLCLVTLPIIMVSAFG